MTQLVVTTRVASISRASTFSTVVFLLTLISSPAAAFDISGQKWPGAVTNFYFDISGASASGILWNTALNEAAQEWNSETSFTFNIIPEYRDPCARDSVNGADFFATVCGNDFGEGVLAVALRSLNDAILGPPEITEADIVFNSSRNYDIYDGRLVQFGFPVNRVDFRRVALHELGHTLGLDHEDSNDIPAIMASNISNLDRLQEDDIAGANSLYGGLSNCQVKPLRLGVINDSLSSDDCTVDELTAGTGDGSFVDIFSVTLTSPGRLAVTMTSDILDSVLILADASLNYLAVDPAAFDLCNSSLSQNLPAGDYLLIANTFNSQAKPQCVTEGPYQLKVSLSSDVQFPLADVRSLNGTPTSAQFSGGVRVNGQASFQNTAKPTDSLNVEATIAVDSVHTGELGFIVVAGFFDGRTFLMNENSEFIDSNDLDAVIIPARRKVLEEHEQVLILQNLVPEDLGINEAEINFLVGYGVDSDPSEIYYHEVPINLSIAP